MSNDDDWDNDDDSAETLIPASDDPFAVALAGYSDRETEEQAVAIRPLLESLLPLVSSGRVLLPSDEEGRDDAELRGQIDGIPVRIVVDDTGFWEVEARVEGELALVLQYDPEKIPTQADADDPWAAEDVVRVFLAKGVFVEDEAEDIESSIAALSAIPPDDLAVILYGFETLPIEMIAFGLELTISPLGGRIEEFVAPRDTMECLLKYVAKIGRLNTVANVAPLAQHTCGYCSSRFFFGVNRRACPNCGAPAEGVGS